MLMQGLLHKMIAQNAEGFLSKNKKSSSRFKNNKNKFVESAEMQDNRAKRVSFKNYLRELEEYELEEGLIDENED